MRGAANPAPHPSPRPTTIHGNSLALTRSCTARPTRCACKARIATVLQAMRKQLGAGLPQPRQHRCCAGCVISGGQGAHEPSPLSEACEDCRQAYQACLQRTAIVERTHTHALTHALTRIQRA